MYFPFLQSCSLLVASLTITKFNCGATYSFSFTILSVERGYREVAIRKIWFWRRLHLQSLTKATVVTRQSLEMKVATGGVDMESEPKFLVLVPDVYYLQPQQTNDCSGKK